MIRPLEWQGSASDGELRMIDQRLLPAQVSWVSCRRSTQVAARIADMTIRGAPAIGLAAAYGMVLASQEADDAALKGDLRRKFLVVAQAELAATRPTAVNLFWALERCGAALEAGANTGALLEVARQLHEEDVAGNRRIGEDGAKLITAGMGVLTHCNAGALATGGWGTGLSPLFVAHERGVPFHVFVDETRPRLQGARLTAWELDQAGIPHTLICDNMAASLMRAGKIQLCLTGADRIAANGDVANKIGTYGVAVAAKHHGITLAVAAPRSTFDLKIASGAQIPIEERSQDEVTQWGDERICPKGTKAFNPGFDVTPAELVTTLLTDRGVISPVNAAGIALVLKG
ncbi:MAG: S-methyl-5-thioribose-1-phosphate isomerase [Archangium sp.]|nr:S-methyl-5-thioribose-1-phosphate isomerase [Archangium sp.]